MGFDTIEINLVHYNYDCRLDHFLHDVVPSGDVFNHNKFLHSLKDVI